MDWTEVNEISNLLSIFTSFIPFFIAAKGFNISNLHKLLFIYYLADILLNVSTFIIYKFYDYDSYWLDPLYYVNFLGVISLFIYKSTNITILKRGILFLAPLGLLAALYRAFAVVNLKQYDEYSWFCIQAYFVIIHLIVIRKELLNPKILVSKNPLFLISSGFLIACIFPIVSGILQHKLYEMSPDYFQISLIVLNLSFIVSNLIIARGIYFLRGR